MSNESLRNKEVVCVGRCYIPALKGDFPVNDETWEKVADNLQEGQETRALSRETIKNFRGVSETIARLLFDSGSHGLGDKLGWVVRLEEDNTPLVESAAASFLSQLGRSNFYASSFICRVAQRVSIAWTVPPWFSEYFSGNSEFRDHFFSTFDLELVSRTNTGDEVSPLEKERVWAINDLYYMHELAVQVFCFLEDKCPGIVRGDFRPHDDRRHRNNAWRRSLLLGGLREEFGWLGHGQPTLRELMEASYQTLLEGSHLLEPDQTPTRFVFSPRHATS